jgi:RNA polymerase sigma-54 factor
LHAEGIDIARRTVAKYREAMGIGSSTQRKQKY